MFVGKLVIKPSYSIVAVAKFGAGTEEVAGSRRQIQDGVTSGSWPEARATSGASRRNLGRWEILGESRERVAGSQTYF